MQFRSMSAVAFLTAVVFLACAGLAYGQEQCNFYGCGGGDTFTLTIAGPCPSQADLQATLGNPGLDAFTNYSQNVCHGQGTQPTISASYDPTTNECTITYQGPYIPAGSCFQYDPAHPCTCPHFGIAGSGGLTVLGGSWSTTNTLPNQEVCKAVTKTDAAGASGGPAGLARATLATMVLWVRAQPTCRLFPSSVTRA